MNFECIRCEKYREPLGEPQEASRCARIYPDTFYRKRICDDR